MSTWMSELPSQIANKIPFNQLAIPGSHDAGASYLDPKSPICPGKTCFIHYCLMVCSYCYEVFRLMSSDHVTVGF